MRADAELVDQLVIALRILYEEEKDRGSCFFIPEIALIVQRIEAALARMEKNVEQRAEALATPDPEHCVPRDRPARVCKDELPHFDRRPKSGVGASADRALTTVHHGRFGGVEKRDYRPPIPRLPSTNPPTTVHQSPDYRPPLKL